MQRRLSETIIDELVRDYVAGSSIDSLAERLHVHRTTIISYLDRRGIERRRNVRRMTDSWVREAAKGYASGESLKGWLRSASTSTRRPSPGSSSEPASRSVRDVGGNHVP